MKGAADAAAAEGAGRPRLSEGLWPFEIQQNKKIQLRFPDDPGTAFAPAQVRREIFSIGKDLLKTGTAFRPS